MHPAIKKIYISALRHNHKISVIKNTIHIDKKVDGWGGSKMSIQIMDNNCYKLTGYYDDGKVRYIRNYKNEFLYGLSVGYYQHAEHIKYKGHYINNQKHGKWEHYAADGRLEKSETFENGKKVFQDAIQHEGPTVIIMRKICANEWWRQMRRKGEKIEVFQVDPEVCISCRTGLVH